MMDNLPLVSVIITTRNEAKNIGNCLSSIKKQDYPQDKIEIIVVDNDSDDSTKDIARKYTEKIYNFGPERSAQRNFGVKQSKGEYTLYLDADMSLSKEVISESVNKCIKDGFIALYIPEKITGTGFWIGVRNFERSFYNATCIDAVRFVRKDKFLEIKGFDENLTGPEDWDFDRRIKETGKTSLITAPIFHNEEDFSFKKYFNKKIYYVKSFEKYIYKWGKDDPIIKKQLGFSFRIFGVFTEDKKWKKLFRHPILALGMYFLRIMLGIWYIIKK